MSIDGATPLNRPDAPAERHGTAAWTVKNVPVTLVLRISVKAGRGCFADRPMRQHAGVREQDIQRFELVPDPRDDAFHRVMSGHVDGEGEHAGAEFCWRGIEQGWVAVRDRHSRAFDDKQPRVANPIPLAR